MQPRSRPWLSRISDDWIEDGQRVLAGLCQKLKNCSTTKRIADEDSPTLRTIAFFHEGNSRHHIIHSIMGQPTVSRETAPAKLETRNAITIRQALAYGAIDGRHVKVKVIFVSLVCAWSWPYGSARQ
eukprot:CAMPEP_0197637752 /NCGR_PEP_ID=MMETSP1338-20131121/12879_1 /TAXON_ID=43686 ORGANISM="Pelagodinium beii, Strain RCC1491" /NCGR_SAMPLE_ID=MMETSP1338 /ASSEMBLY_ACC=CAM_ASM_000754 /LENGTH=126 /DNA_ID=CAMNT_0043210213 /DNA_START=773 /DNA_END=1153 /DNA_ORIENTATION=-